MSEDGRNLKSSQAGRGIRIKFGRRPAWLMLLVLLVLVVAAAYQITVGLGMHDRESFFEELWGVLGIVLLFLVGGAALGILLVAVKSLLRWRRGPTPWGDDEIGSGDAGDAGDAGDESDGGG